MTCSSQDEAMSIGSQLVEEKLAACANVMSPMISIYQWQGVLEKNTEAVLVLKTTKARLDACQSRIESMHSYEIPCVIAIKVDGVNKKFAAWVDQTLMLQ